MIPEAKFPAIVKGLLDKTKQGKVAWNGTDHPEYDYIFRFPGKSSVTLGRFSDQGQPTVIEVRILSSGGKTVGLWEVNENDPNWDLVNALYSEVEGVGWRKILDDLEKFISAES